MPYDWIVWQPETSFGKFRWIEAKSEFEISGTAGGVIVQDVEVAPGQTIHVTATCTKKGEGQPFVSVAMLDKAKQQVAGSVAPPSVLNLVDPATGEMELHGRWIVPDGCSIFRVVFGARSQGDSDDIVRVREIEAFRIDPIR